MTIKTLIKLAVVCIGSISLLLIFKWQIESIVFLAFFATLFLWNLDSRISIGLGIACLVGIPVLTLLFRWSIYFGGDYWSQRVAVWAYYFLAIGVIKQVVDFIRHPETDNVHASDSTASHS